MNRIALAALLIVIPELAAFAQAPAVDLKGKTLAATLDELLPGFSATDLKAREAAQQRWQSICFRAGAPGNEPLRAEACGLMTAKLAAPLPSAARIWLLTQLEHLGREESVAAVAARLSDPDELVREAAVRALTNNPSPKATLRIAKQLSSANGTAKIGLLNALGHRGDAVAIEAIIKELGGGGDIAIAAARALGKIPTPAALTALAAAEIAAEGPVRLAVANALLAHADRALAAGNRERAARIYRSLSKPGEAKPIRLAALRGSIQSSGDSAGEKILEALAGDDADARAIAVGQIESISPAAIKSITDGIGKLKTPDRVLVITALAARGDRSQMPVALAAARDSDAEVRRAGLQALGRLGDSSVVGFLLGAMAENNDLARVATDSLVRLSTSGVDEKLIVILEKAEQADRAAALIGVLERRKAVSAIPQLLARAGGRDPAVRSAAFTALKSLGSPNDAPAMVAALLKTEIGADRDRAEQAVAAVCKQNPNKAQWAGPVLAAIKNARETGKDLLPLLGRIGGTEALAMIRENLAASDPALRAAALAGICHWPDAAASADLLTLAERADNPDRRRKALRAVIRINTAKSDRTPEERLAALNVLKRAMALAGADDERRAILEGAANLRHIETLRFILPYLDQSPLAQSACKCTVELAHNRPLREPNKAEFEKALDRVIELCRDKGLVERAKQYRAGR